MSFRGRLTLVAATAVALAVAVASLVTYVVARDALRGEVDDALVEGATRATLGSEGGGFVVRLAVGRVGAATPALRLVSADEGVPTPPSSVPAGPRDRAVAMGTEPAYYEDDVVDGQHVRIYTTQVAPNLALRLARSLEETDQTLSRLRLLLLLVGLAGIGLAAALGLAVARTALGPVRRLTDAAEHVTATRDLSGRIEARGADELSRLARSFNTMLEALDRSVRTQRQLVADASHELRTPLTSARTNVELVASGVRMTAAERKRMLADSVEQLDELSALVGDVVDLARDGEHEQELEEIRLDLLAADVMERVGRRHPDVRFHAGLEETLVRAAAPRVDRAVTNLLENAAAWSPPGETVTMTVRNEGLSVRDAGPGIGPDDLPHVFDRFYRAPSARGKPGSGLGLAIVRQVAETHGGRVWIECPPEGGTVVHLEFLSNS
jgi:two-component system sensor histidine kinase MprB